MTVLAEDVRVFPCLAASHTRRQVQPQLRAAQAVCAAGAPGGGYGGASAIAGVVQVGRWSEGPAAEAREH